MVQNPQSEIELVNRFSTMCTHGHVVMNPYTRQYVYVPCGECPACLYAKALQNTLLCKTQERHSKYCYFVTLTYASKFVPYYTLVKIPNTNEVSRNSKGDSVSTDLYRLNIRPRLPIYRTYKSRRNSDLSSLCKGDRHLSVVRGLCMDDEHESFVRLSEKYYNDYTRQADLSMNGKYPQYIGRYGYLCRKDLQLFMKRLRYAIYKKVGHYEKIYSYIVGEYGPRTFRPHFHLLLFFEKDWISSCIGQIVVSCWPFGRVDCSASRKDAASYVAGYTNSSGRTPFHIRNCRKIRPFGRFSNGFGNHLLAFFLDRARRADFVPFVDGYYVDYNGRPFKLRPRRSHLDTCFFRPSSNLRCSLFELSSLVSKVCDILSRPAYRKRTIFGVVREMWHYYYEVLTPDQLHYICDEIEPVDSVFLDLCYYLKIDPTDLVSEEFKRSFISRFYSLFLCTVRFLKGHNIDPYRFPQTSKYLHKWLKISMDFYAWRDYHSLIDGYRFIASYGDDNYEFIVTPSEENLVKFNRTHISSLATDRINMLSNMAIKHREINDLNIKFVHYDAI